MLQSPSSSRCLAAPHRAPARGVSHRASTRGVARAAEAFTPVLSANDLPKGSRFVVTGPGGKAAMLFWYRDSVFAVEPRSPAEGAYSEGFVTARFTQDGCIECPTTKTTFDLATGAIKAWYPDNPVLRALTPIETCRPMDVFPARLSADGKTVEVAWGEAPSVGGAAVTSGGADSSIERNNVYGIEPRVYLEDGRTIEESTGRPKAKPAEIIVATVAIAGVAVAGSAVAIYAESIPALILFWVALLLPVGLYVFKPETKA